MARVNTGDYKIEFYDGYGSKLRDMTTTSTSLTSSQMIGSSKIAPTLEDGDLTTAKSYSVDRRLFNSLE